MARIVCVRELVCALSGGGRGGLLTHVHRASACTLNAVGLLPVSGCGDARVAPPLPHHSLCVWRNLKYLTYNIHLTPLTLILIPRSRIRGGATRRRRIACSAGPQLYKYNMPA